MSKFKNRLIKSASTGSSKSSKIKKQLRGEELFNFVEDHRKDFNGNGDQLCVEAGYGEYSNNGDAICNFKPFVKELSKVMDLENDMS